MPEKAATAESSEPPAEASGTQEGRSGTARPEAANATKASNDRHFRTDHLLGDLRGRSVRGGAHTILGQSASVLIQFGSTAVLARLLVPDDFGLIAMVAAIIGFVRMFKDLGLSTVTIQRADITHEQVSTLFWVNVAISAGLMLITASAAPLISWFYGEPRLVGITLALSATFLLGGLTVQHQALLRRQMRFGTLALVAIASQIVAVAVGIVGALSGLGYWALVAMNAANAAANAAFVWIACGWRPGPPVRGVGVRSMLAFGGQVSASEFLGYICRNIDKVLLGAMHGAAALGFYAKAYQLLLLPMRQINAPMKRIALPALSRLRVDPARYRRFYTKAIGMLVTCGMPVVVFAFVDVRTIVLTLLGDQWHESILIFQCLAPAAFIGTLNVAGGWVNLSLGRADRTLRAKIVTTTLLMFAIFSGLPYGPVGVATMISIVEVVSRAPILAYQLHGSPVSLLDVGRAIWRPATASIGAGALLFLCLKPIGTIGNLPAELLVGAAFYGVFYLLLWLLLPGGREILGEIVGLARELKRKRASKPETAVQT